MDNMHKAAADILQKAFAPAQETEQQETAEPTEDQETEIQTSETLETQAEQETEPASQETDSQDDISTLNRLAETLDIDIADMYALNLNMPNGDPVALGELKDFYEQNTDLDNARREIENERSKLQADRDKAEQLPPIHQELVQALANKTVIEQEWQALEQSGLRQTNAGEYSAKAVELQNKYQMTMAQLGNVNQEVERKQVERLAANQQELHKLVPDLKDDAKREAIAKRVDGMFKHFGVDTSYIGMVEDPRAMQMLIEVSNLFEQKGNFRKKRVDTAPKVLKPQAVKQSEAGRSAAIKRLTEKARNSGQRGDQVAAVSALIRG
jgi:hypothetical protein